MAKKVGENRRDSKMKKSKMMKLRLGGDEYLAQVSVNLELF